MRLDCAEGGQTWVTWATPYAGSAFLVPWCSSSDVTFASASICVRLPALNADFWRCAVLGCRLAIMDCSNPSTTRCDLLHIYAFGPALTRQHTVKLDGQQFDSESGLEVSPDGALCASIIGDRYAVAAEQELAVIELASGALHRFHLADRLTESGMSGLVLESILHVVWLFDCTTIVIRETDGAHELPYARAHIFSIAD